MSLFHRSDVERRHRMEKRLIYSYYRCSCGALYAYDPKVKPRPVQWDCSDVILGLAEAKGRLGAVRHSDVMPFVFWKSTAAPGAWAHRHRVERP